MIDITLHPVAKTDAAELQFELGNRDFFERFIAGFGDDYYHLEAVARILAQCVEAWTEGQSYAYLIRGAAGTPERPQKVLRTTPKVFRRLLH